MGNAIVQRDGVLDSIVVVTAPLLLLQRPRAIIFVAAAAIEPARAAHAEAEIPELVRLTAGARPYGKDGVLHVARGNV